MKMPDLKFIERYIEIIICYCRKSSVLQRFNNLKILYWVLIRNGTLIETMYWQAKFKAKTNSLPFPMNKNPPSFLK